MKKQDITDLMNLCNKHKVKYKQSAILSTRRMSKIYGRFVVIWYEI